MRADRLVAALLILQARERVTAAQLAGELEVSPKTARRDLEALAMAGIPVYAQPGRGGGWSLLGGARTDLSGLTATEARTLFLLAGPSASVAPEAKAALRKLVQALPEPFRGEAAAAASAVVIDPAKWGGRTDPAAVSRDPAARGHRGRAAPADLCRPAGDRHRAHGAPARTGPEGHRLVPGCRVRCRPACLPRLPHPRRYSHGDPVVRPQGFDLAEAWRSVVARTDAREAGRGPT